MKFLELKHAHGATYAVFEFESAEEQDFFKNISPIKKNGSFYKLSETIQSWLINSASPPILGGIENTIMIIVNHSYSFTLFAQSNPIFNFLDYLFDKNFIKNNPSKELIEFTNKLESTSNLNLV